MTHGKDGRVVQEAVQEAEVTVATFEGVKVWHLCVCFRIVVLVVLVVVDPPKPASSLGDFELVR
jgi:hypothetical protein